MRAGWIVVMAGALAAPLTAQAAPKAVKNAAQDMMDGRWRGWLQQPDQDSIRVSYDVQHVGKHIVITLTGRSGVTYDMAGAKVKNDVLTFDWNTGPASFLYCRLSRRDGMTFEGICNDRSPGETGSGIHLWMMMTPPGT
ncbi:MAG TPA: hypothetical protein VGM77_12440 [Gemmatimonadales bacterium]